MHRYTQVNDALSSGMTRHSRLTQKSSSLPVAARCEGCLSVSDQGFHSARWVLEGINILTEEPKINHLTMLAPTTSAIVCAKPFELQAHVKGPLLLEDLLDGQVASVRRSGTWRKAGFFNECVQSLTWKHFSMRCPDDGAW